MKKLLFPEVRRASSACRTERVCRRSAGRVGDVRYRTAFWGSEERSGHDAHPYKDGAILGHPEGIRGRCRGVSRGQRTSLQEMERDRTGRDEGRQE